MCFFIQSCEPLGRKKKKSRKKNAHRSFMSLVSYLPPLPPPSPHFPQLTETWQWPTCMCWQPKLMLLFFWSHLLGLGRVLPLTSCHPRNPFGLQCWPVPLEQGLPLLGMHEPAPLRCGHPDCEYSAPPGPSSSGCNSPPCPVSVRVTVSQGGAGDIFLKQLQK